jgi:predicted metal-binding membrane protein
MTPLSLPTINYLAILPELIVLGGALLLMLATALTRSRLSATVATTSTVLVGVAVGVVGLFQWHSLVQHGNTTHVGPRRGPRRLLRARDRCARRSARVVGPGGSRLVGA